jgi:hypothetical protein
MNYAYTAINEFEKEFNFSNRITAEERVKNFENLYKYYHKK